MQTDRPAANRDSVEHVLNLVPATTFLLSSAYGELRSAVVVKCVQQVAMHPPMMLVAMEKGQSLSPVIRDSRNFAICVLAHDDRATRMMFATAPDQGVDAFLTIPHLIVPGGSPVPMRALGYIACELVRHLDIEADYEVYIGMVHHAGLVEQPKTKVARRGVSRVHSHGWARIAKRSPSTEKPNGTGRARASSKVRRPS
ncbi:MAG: flavin reductase [Phycisphaerales bacterium]|nr:flavin reductase [Phycisphaerales bacterium]